jgi:hypothetical protein
MSVYRGNYEYKPKGETLSDDMKEVGLETKVTKGMTDG